MCLRAIVSREFNNVVDRRAEDYLENIGLEITTVSKEGTGAGGGYLVPAPLSATIIDVKERVGVARKVCRVLPTPGDTLSIPKRAGGLTVYYPDEAATITDSTKGWGQVACNLRKRAVVTLLSSELVDDAIISVTDDAVTEMAYALALQEDNELINGTGASTYGTVQGLLNAVGAGGVSTAAASTTWAAVTMAELMACVGLLPDRFFDYGAAWICSYSFFNQVMVRLAFAAGGATASEIMGGVGNVRSFAGYPVYLTSQMPTSTGTAQKSAIFGAFNQAVILADKGGPRIARSNDVKFLEDQIALRATSRYDMTVHEPGTASAAGAYVVFSTHS
jgi:HK97 family phage major capsid protein